MVEQNKNKGPNDFDDDAFDVEEFADADFDEALTDEEYVDEEFSDEEWEEEPAAKKGKGKPSGKERKSLSFNTIVIIGAVIVGAGVLLLNIKSKSSEVQGPKTSVFQSVLGVAEVMDGGIFGGTDASPQEQEGERSPQDAAATPEASPPEEEQGFLANPETVNTPVARGETQNPPAPMPIAPVETQSSVNEPLTPMPDMTAVLPRGPEETGNGEAAVTPEPDHSAVGTEEAIPAEPVSAKDILEQAISNHEKKADEDADKQQGMEMPVAAPVVKEKATVVEAKAPEAALPGDMAAVRDLEGKIDLLLKRMDQIENDLGEVKETKKADYEQIRESVQSLKKDLAGIKDRPVSSPPAQEEPPKPVAAKPKKAAKPVKRTHEAAVESPYPVTVSSTQWELRAAQPGRAWVSRPGSGDVRGITVGETVPGIGRVTGILYQGGRWTVEGTLGRISQ